MEPVPDGVGGRQRDKKRQKLSLEDQASLSRYAPIPFLSLPPAIFLPSNTNTYFSLSTCPVSRSSFKSYPPPATPVHDSIHTTCGTHRHFPPALAAHASSSTSCAAMALDDGLGFTLLRWEMLLPVVVPSIPTSDGCVLLVEHELDYRLFRLFAYCKRCVWVILVDTILCSLLRCLVV